MVGFFKYVGEIKLLTVDVLQCAYLNSLCKMLGRLMNTIMLLTFDMLHVMSVCPCTLGPSLYIILNKTK